MDSPLGQQMGHCLEHLSGHLTDYQSFQTVQLLESLLVTKSQELSMAYREYTAPVLVVMLAPMLAQVMDLVLLAILMVDPLVMVLETHC